MNKIVRSFLTTSKLHYKIRTLQTSQKREKLPIILFTLIKPIARITSYVLGRNVRGAWKKLPQEQQRTYIEIMKANRGKFLLSGFFSGTGLYYLYESHIQYCPITGRRKFVALTPDQARKIGEANFTQILEEVEGIIVPESDPVYLRVTLIQYTCCPKYFVKSCFKIFGSDLFLLKCCSYTCWILDYWDVYRSSNNVCLVNFKWREVPGTTPTCKC